MNDRLKELMLEAGYAAPEYAFRAHKLAELIVQECARVARANPCPNFQEHLKQQLGHTWDIASVEAGNRIEKHFRIEE